MAAAVYIAAEEVLTMRRILIALFTLSLLGAGCSDDVTKLDGKVKKDTGVRKDLGADVGEVDQGTAVDQSTVDKGTVDQSKADKAKVDAPKADAPKGDVAKVDGPKPDAQKGCGNVNYVGCCIDDTSRQYCSNGYLIKKTCSGTTPTCGWNASSKFYGCGTSATAEPTGTYPRLCSALPDGGPLPGVEAGVKKEAGVPDLPVIKDLAKPDLPAVDAPKPDAPQTDGPKVDLSKADAPKADATASLAGLVINEVDYNQPGSPDSKEFIEIYNGTGSAQNFAELAVVLINGSSNPGAEYKRVALSTAGIVPAGGYVVIASSTVVVDAGAHKVILFSAASDNVQNGAPDGVVLINATTNTVIDALSYEGSITAAQITGFTSTVSLVEGTAATAKDSTSVDGSLCRSPNGTDTNNADSDWKFCATLTPGKAN